MDKKHARYYVISATLLWKRIHCELDQSQMIKYPDSKFGLNSVGWALGINGGFKAED